MTSKFKAELEERGLYIITTQTWFYDKTICVPCVTDIADLQKGDPVVILYNAAARIATVEENYWEGEVEYLEHSWILNKVEYFDHGWVLNKINYKKFKKMYGALKDLESSYDN